MKKIPALNVVMAAAFLMLSTNACSFLGPKTDEINIQSSPREVEVIVNNESMTTPCTITVPRNKGVSILAIKEGYIDERKKVGYTLSPYGIMDIVGTLVIFVPVIGLISPGAYEHEEHNVFFRLAKEEPSEDD